MNYKSMSAIAVMILIITITSFGQAEMRTDNLSRLNSEVVTVRDGQVSHLTIQNTGKVRIVTVRNGETDLAASVDIWIVDDETGEEVYRSTKDLGERETIEISIDDVLAEVPQSKRGVYSIHIVAFNDARPVDGPFSERTLPVAFFAQCDSRWRNDLVGRSGKTICQIGCAMTSVAMASASKLSNSNPKTMNAWLSSNSGYDSNGLLYWAKPTQWQPSAGFRYLGDGKVTSPSNLKALIDAGKFVVAWSSRFGNHWVLVYKYTGNGSNLSDFEYLDPADSSWSLKKVGDRFVTASSKTRIYQ